MQVSKLFIICVFWILTSAIKDLVSRLSCESKRSAKDHQALMRHFNRSWTDLAAGGGQRYMKPQCVVRIPSRSSIIL